MKNLKQLAGLLVASLALGANSPSAQESAVPSVLSTDGTTLNALEKRVLELEQMLFEVDSRLGSRPSLLSYSGQSVDFGGALSSLGTYARGDDSSTLSINALFLELYIKARLSDNYSVFATPGFFWLRDPTYTDASNPTIPLDDTEDARLTLQRGYAEYHPSDAINLKIGRWGTSHGVITSEYFVPTRILLASPMMTRVFGQNTLYPQKLDGLHFSGNTALGVNTLEYNAYVGVDVFNADEFATGARVALKLDELGLKVSANAGHGERAGFLSFAPTATPLYANIPSFFSIFPAPSNSDDPYNFYGIDMDYRRGSWVVKSEAYVTDEDAEGPAAGDRNGYYFQPAYYITPEWAVVMRYDVFNAGQGLGKAREIVLGVNYDPNPNVRWRLEFSNIDTSDVVLASTDPSMSNPVPRSAADSIQVLTFSASFSF